MPAFSESRVIHSELLKAGHMADDYAAKLKLAND
jgi:hypothetical protein